jgi:WD40 repeat protein
MVWAPDNRHMATWGSLGILYVWDTSNGKMVCSYSKHWEQHQNDQQFPNISPAIAWSPDSTRIVSSVASSDIMHSNDGVIHVWDARSAQEICTFNHGQPNTGAGYMAWSADSQLIVCTIKGGSVVWDARSGAIITTRYTQSGYDDVAWHPQRRYLASTMESTTDTDDGYKGYIWDAMTGKEILRLNSTTHDILAWSPDGLRLALATLNDTVEIWQIWE